MICELSHCPECGVIWDGEDIFEHFLGRRSDGDPFYKDKSDEQILEVAESYGWSLESPKRFRYLIGIELSSIYDGVSLWECPKCHTRWNRQTNQKETEEGQKCQR